MGVGAGLAVGLAGARAMSTLVAAQLYQMSPTDIRVYLGVAVFVAVVAAVACWPPTRRAAREEAKQAMSALDLLPASPAKQALIDLCARSVERSS